MRTHWIVKNGAFDHVVTVSVGTHAPRTIAEIEAAAERNGIELERVRIERPFGVDAIEDEPRVDGFDAFAAGYLLDHPVAVDPPAKRVLGALRREYDVWASRRDAGAAQRPQEARCGHDGCSLVGHHQVTVPGPRGGRDVLLVCGEHLDAILRGGGEGAYEAVTVIRPIGARPR